jgi:hypothetical protein
MQKIDFKNLPDTSTPINEENLNQLQTNVENAINGIIESGSNANGTWIKWADGTMECTKTVEGTTSTTTSWGSLYEGGVVCGNYAQPFIEKPRTNATGQKGLGNVIQCFGSNQNATSWGTLYILNPTSNGSCNYSIDLIAKGRWK